MRQTKINKLQRLQRTIAGIQKYFPNAQTLTLKGKTVPTQTVLTLLQSDIDALKAVLTALSKFHDAVAGEKGIAAQVKPTLNAIKTMVLNLLGDSQEVLNDFDISASPPRKTTVDAKAAAVAKARATRKAHGIQGKRQRKQNNAPTAPATPKT